MYKAFKGSKSVPASGRKEQSDLVGKAAILEAYQTNSGIERRGGKTKLL
jgi:hypothetical protein